MIVLLGLVSFGLKFVLLGLVSFGLELMLNYIESQVSVFLLLISL